MEKIAKVDQLRNKLEPTVEDWKDCVRLYAEATDDPSLHSPDNAIRLADCYKDAAIILLERLEKTPENFAAALKFFGSLAEVAPSVPNWFEVYDTHLMARMAPAAYGFDPSLVDVGDDDQIDSLATNLMRHKGILETVYSLQKFIDRCILQPALLSGHSLTENRVAVRVIERLISACETETAGSNHLLEITYTSRGQLHQYCKEKTEETFAEALSSYKRAIANKKPNLFVYNGAGASYVCLIDLLERPAVHGFDFVRSEEDVELELKELRKERDEWYKSDPTRRLMYYEMLMLTNHDCHFRVFPLLSPNESMVRRALTLGSAALDESNNDFVRQNVALALALINHHSLPRSEASLREALKYYRLTISIDTSQRNSLEMDVTYVNVSVADRTRAHTNFTSENIRKALINVLPVCFFPENHPDFQPLTAELKEFEEYVESFCTVTAAHGQPEISRKTISSCFPDYRDSVRQVREVMSNLPNSEQIKKNPIVLSAAKHVGAAALSGNSERTKAEKTYTDLIEKLSGKAD